MGIRRVGTSTSQLHVLDLSDFEFSPGWRGVGERMMLASKHAAIRLWRAVQFFFTSFLGLHYLYVIAWALVLSWILYPQHNMSYTDALFQGVSAVTLTGLNTVNVNEMKLYQQLFLFIVPVFTHPLTVASFMVYYRLYMYKRKFDDIDTTSKNQSRLRRAHTISQYESQNPRGPNYKPPEINVQLSGRRGSGGPNPPGDLFSRGDAFPSSQGASTSDASSSGKLPPKTSDPSDAWRADPRPSVDDDDEEPNKIRFGDLPRPPSRPTQDHHNPSEMYRSLNMMRSQLPDDGMDEDDGPALVIKSPRDIEADELRGIHSAVAAPPAAGSSANTPGADTHGGGPGGADTGGTDHGGTDQGGPGGHGSAGTGRGNGNALAGTGNNAANVGPDPPSAGNPGSPINDSTPSGTGPNTSYNTSASAPANPYNGNYSNRRFSSYSDQGFRPQRTLTRTDTLMSMASARNPREMRANYLSWTPTVSRNSAFIGLTKEQKEELGGVEYRALKMLRYITFAYFVGVLCLGWVFLVPWVYKQQHYAEQIRSNGVSPVMFAMSTTLSAFNNNGYCTLPSSLSIFWHSAYVPVVVSFIVMAGNVAIPILLRAAVWVVFKLSPPFGQTRETLGFLLDHPRRCFMLLFPTVTTVWLLLTIVVFIIVEVALFMILNHGEHSPQPDMAAGPRLLSAYFQSIVVRTVGLTMINVGSQAPGMLVLNTVMMYVAIYPVAMSIRKSNVYEEQTIGRYYPVATTSSSGSIHSSVSSNAIDDDDDETRPVPGSSGGFLRRRFSNLSARFRPHAAGDDPAAERPRHYTGPEAADDDEDDEDNPSTLVDHMRRQLSMDIWSLVLGLMLIAIIEGGPITRGEFTLFAVIYEVVSAHGTVGLSMGYGSTSLALSGGFSNLGKLVMMAIMIRGRHRAMPYNVDRAIILRGSDIIRRDREQENRVRDAKMYVHREPSQSGSWLPRISTTASRMASFGTLRRRPSTFRARDDA